MIPTTVALLVGILAFFVGILVCLVLLNTTGQLKLKDWPPWAHKAGNHPPIWDIDAGSLREIYNLISKISSTLEYQGVIETSLDLGSKVLETPHVPPDKLVSIVLLFSETGQGRPALIVGSARRLTQPDLKVILPGTSGIIRDALATGTPKSHTEIFRDPEFSHFVSLRSCRAAYCQPLRSGLDTYGLILYAHPDADFFTPSKREVLDIIAHQTVIAIQNASLYRDLQHEKERMIEIQEQEHRALARDLHDGPTQSMAAIAMRINFARRLLERDPKSIADELAKIEELARRTTTEIRHMLFTLRPLELETQGLVGALRVMAEKTHAAYDQNIIVEADENVISRLEMSRQTIIFYIAEEAINNACKYAQAKHIWVRLNYTDRDFVLLEVQDDGVGFDTQGIETLAEQRGSLGLKNMRERVEMVNGNLQIKSEPGKGTTVRVYVPLTQEAAERLR